jgi:hypothetical protein
MGALVSFFAGGAARVQALLIGAMASALVAAALLALALWWRGEAYQARGLRDAALLQAQVLAKGIVSCNAGVAAAEKAAQDAVNTSRKLLAEARRLAKPAIAEVKRIEELLKQKTPTARADGSPPGCDDAWTAIEKG